MDESNNGGSSLPPFLTKTYGMVDDSSSDSIVSWSQNNKASSFETHQSFQETFFLDSSNTTTSQALSDSLTHGFRKFDLEQWEFANDDFVRGKPHLMKNIHRRKPVHSHSSPSLQPQQNSLSDSERQRMSNQIEKLVKEKEGLLEELHKKEEEREVFEEQVKKLKDQLQHMGKRQKTMVSFVSKCSQSQQSM